MVFLFEVFIKIKNIQIKNMQFLVYNINLALSLKILDDKILTFQRKLNYKYFSI